MLQAFFEVIATVAVAAAYMGGALLLFHALMYVDRSWSRSRGTPHPRDGARARPAGRRLAAPQQRIHGGNPPRRVRPVGPPSYDDPERAA